MKQPVSLLGVGIYTIPEAARITGVSSPRIRRWLRGYQFRSGDALHQSPPVWKPDIPEIDGALAVSFRDLMEVRFVDYFVSKGVSWKTLRDAAGYAAEIICSSHPFSTFKFKTDGKRIFADFVQERRAVLDVGTRQYNFPVIIEPYLYEGVEFDGETPFRWFPLGRSKRVVIDPRIGFGQPTANPEGVPTAILAKAAKVEGSIEVVAKWYKVPTQTVQAAVEYEQHLAA